LNSTEEQQLEEQMYNRILNNIGFIEEDVTELQAAEQEAPRRRFKVWYAIAGLAAACLIFVSVILFNNKPVNQDSVIADVHATELMQITNNTRHIYKTTLPDSSVVWLNPNSQVSFPKKFNARFRAITMAGECFFEVTKNPKRPFIITSRAIVTKVWGTSFRVRDGINSKLTDVSVLTGKVSVSIKNKETETPDFELRKNEVMLHPHQKAVYFADKNILLAETINNSTLQIWNRVNLSFESKPLSEIIPVLNSKFHVQIKVANERLNHYILNADMVGFNLPDVLEALKKSLNVDYEINNSTIELE